MQAGLLPSRDAIEDKDKPWVAALVKAFRSPEVRSFVGTSLKGSLIPAF